MRDDSSKMERSLANSVDRKPSTIDHGERRKRATARVVEVVARCLVLGLRSSCGVVATDKSNTTLLSGSARFVLSPMLDQIGDIPIPINA